MDKNDQKMTKNDVFLSKMNRNWLYDQKVTLLAFLRRLIFFSSFSKKTY